MSEKKPDMSSATRLMCIKLEQLYQEWVRNGRRTRECADEESAHSSALRDTREP